jgi:hypothetical protein
MKRRLGSPARRFGTRTLSAFAIIAAPMLAALLVTAPARAESLYGNRQSFWQGQLGMRSTFVTDRAFDPFATDNALTTVSLGFARTLFEHDAFSFAPGVIWDYGARSATARGHATNLAAHRLALALEGRYHFAPWAYGLVRLTPGTIHQSAELRDTLAPAPFVARNWTFSLDASAGLAFLLGPHGSSPVRWWLAAEGGYGFASSGSLLMRADLGPDDPRRTGDIDLGRLALGGAFFRVYGSVTF